MRTGHCLQALHKPRAMPIMPAIAGDSSSRHSKTPAQPQPQPPRQRFPLATLKVSLVSLLCLATVSYVDYATGYEFLFFVFYFIPVGICGWYMGRLGTLSMAALSGV